MADLCRECKYFVSSSHKRRRPECHLHPPEGHEDWVGVHHTHDWDWPKVDPLGIACSDAKDPTP